MHKGMLRDVLQKILWTTLSLSVVFVFLFSLFYTTEQVQVALGTWTFDTAENYYTSSTNITISGGLVSLQTSGGGGSTTTQDYVDDDNGASEFGGGTHNGTQYDATSSSVQLATGSTTGQFDSRIIDSGAAGTLWTTLEWQPRAPYRVGLPGGAITETWYEEGNVDANDIVTLFRFDESAYTGAVGEAVDSAGASSYSMEPINGASITTSARFGNAAFLDSTSDHFFQVSSTDYLGSATSGTVSVWLYPTVNTGSNKQILAKGDRDTDAGRFVMGLTDANVPLFYHADSINFNANDDYLYGTVGIPYDRWSHVVWWSDGSGYRTYVNGVEDTSLAVQFGIGTDSGDWFGDILDTIDLVTVGSGIRQSDPYGGFENFGGAIDELAVFNRPLTNSEIFNLYERGQQQLRFQVRSCDDSACSGESFIGPDGSASTYYTDSTSTLSLPTTTLTNVINNRYFQYRAYFDTTTTVSSPELVVATSSAQLPGSGTYPTNTPFVGNNIAFPFLTLTSFSHTLGGSNAGSIEYQIAVNNTSTWYYHDGANWTTATSGYPNHTNTTAEITTNAQTIDDDIGSGNLYWRGFLISDGSQAVELDTVQVETTSTIVFTSSTDSVAESAATTSIQVELDEASSSTVSVTYGVSGGTATNSSTDYLLATGTVSVAAGDTTATFSIYIVDDASVEGSETVVITLSNAQGGLLGSTSTHTLTITDNDSPAVTLSTTTLTATEGGATDSYTIVLGSSPSSPVEISLTTSSADIGISTTSIYFTASNYSSPVTVTVTATDDASVEGTHTRTITHTASSSDGNYDGIAISTVTTTITDNDTPGVTISSTTLAIAESATSSYDISLVTAPTNPVTITLTTSSAEVGISTTSITFTASNYSTPVTVTVTATDDNIDQTDYSQTISHSASSADGNYDGISINTTTVSITDDDTAGVTVTTSTVAITEAGTTATYTIQLDTQPTSSVTIAVATDGESTVSTSSIVFTSSTWNSPVTVTVTAVNDSDVEGAHNTTITHTATSGGQYNGITIASVVMSITDDDTAGVTVTESGGSTAITESGTTDSYTIALDTSPSSPVVITVSPDSASSVSTSSITFTASNFSSAVTVTVTAVDDSIAQGGHTSTITHTASSSDGNYDGITIAAVTSTITDDDTAGVTVTESGGSTDVTEAGGTDSYTIVLDSQPTSSVTIAITTSSEIVVSTSSIVFTSSSWNSAVTVTVSTTDDSTAEGAHTGSITHTATQGGGATQYNGISISGVTVNITDDDTAGVTVTESGGDTTTTESGITDTYTLVLNTAPSSSVVITLATTTGDVTLSTTSITFTSSNYSTAVTVTTTAVDDSDTEGTHTDTITHTASSSDSNYDGISISSVTVTITDNEPSVTIGSTALSITEGSTDTVTVVLAVVPTTTVTITPTVDSQLSLSTTSLTFTSSSWNTARTITVTAVEDSTTEGSHQSTITYSASSGGDYNGISVSSTVVTISDASSGSSSGGGGAAAFALLSPPISSPTTNNQSPDSQPVTEPAEQTTSTNQTDTQSPVEETAQPNESSEPAASSPDSLASTPNTTPSRFLPVIIGDLPEATYMIISSPSSDLPIDYKPFESRKLWNLCGSSAECPDGTYTVTVIVYNQFFEQIFSNVYQSELTKSQTASDETKPQLIKDPDDNRVYLVENGVRRWIPSEAVFKSRGYDWNDIRTFASLDEYPIGDPLPGVASVPSRVSQFTQYLSFGARNSQVAALQVLLKDLGFFPADIDATGYYGPITQDAVTTLQQRNSISPLGVVGPLTRSLLNTLLGR